MTFSELMEATYCIQPVKLIFGEESISGDAEALNCYLTDEITKAEVDRIDIEDNVMKVWVVYENRHTDAGSASGAEGQAGKYPGKDGAGECSAGSDCRGQEEAAVDRAQA